MRQRVGTLSLPGDTATCRVARLGEGSLCRGPEREPILGIWAQATKGLWVILVQKECSGWIQISPHVRGRCKDPGQETHWSWEPRWLTT